MSRLWVLLVLVACHHARQVSLAPLPPAAYAHYLAGKLALDHDDPSAAADELALAAAAAPEQPMIAVEQARALAKAKRGDEARLVLAKLRREWPDHAQVWLASGELLEQAAPEEAAVAYRRAIELGPGDERGYLGLARAELAQQHPRRAEATLRTLIIKVPASVDGHYRLAQRLAARGDTHDAMAQLRAVLERDPDHLDARMDLARALRLGGDLQGAIAQTRNAFDRAGQPLDLAEELFWLLCEADDLQGAEDLLALMEDDRSDAETLARIAKLEVGIGRLEIAASIAQRLDAMDADLANLVRVVIALAKNDRTGADDAAKKIAPDSQAAKLATTERLSAAIDAGELEHAKELLDIVDSQRTYFEARLAVREHRIPSARSLLAGILQAHPDNVAALTLAGFLLADQHLDLPAAEQYLRHARQLAPGDPKVLDAWGWLLRAQGKRDEAHRTLQHAAHLAPLDSEIAAHLRDTIKP